MRLGRMVWICVGVALVAWTVWLLTVAGVPPEMPGALTIFYLSLLTALTTSLALALTALQRPRDRRRARGVAFFLPHTLAASFLLLFGLWLQSLRMLSWGNILLLFGLFVIYEGALGLVNRRHSAA